MASYLAKYCFFTEHNGRILRFSSLPLNPADQELYGEYKIEARNDNDALKLALSRKDQVRIVCGRDAKIGLDSLVEIRAVTVPELEKQN